MPYAFAVTLHIADTTRVYDAIDAFRNMQSFSFVQLQVEMPATSKAMHIQAYVEGDFEKFAREQTKLRKLTESFAKAPWMAAARDPEKAHHYCMKPVDDCKCKNCDSERKDPTYLPKYGRHSWGTKREIITRKPMEQIAYDIQSGMTRKQVFMKHLSICMNNPYKLYEWMVQLSPRRYEGAKTVRIYWGVPGSGKTTSALTYLRAKYGEDNVYVLNCSDNTLWWTDYDGQEAVVIEEYKAGMKMATIKCILDAGPRTVDTGSGGRKMPLNAKEIIFTSNYDPEYWYTNISQSDREAFFRRIDEVRYFDKRHDKCPAKYLGVIEQRNTQQNMEQNKAGGLEPLLQARPRDFSGGVTPTRDLVLMDCEANFQDEVLPKTAVLPAAFFPRISMSPPTPNSCTCVGTFYDVDCPVCMY